MDGRRKANLYYVRTLVNSLIQVLVNLDAPVEAVDMLKALDDWATEEMEALK